MLEYNAFLIRYHEIATKGANRRMFENRLVDAIRRLLKEIEDLKVENQRGRIIVHLSSWRTFSEDEMNQAIAGLKKCFGIESFSPCVWFAQTVENVEENTNKVFAAAYEKYINEIDADKKQAGRKISYRMRARRSIKSFPMNSKQMEIHFAEQFLTKFDRLVVDLENAELTIGLEVRDKSGFVWFDQYKGPGGLPVGTSRPVMTLLSGGIDSPAACYTIMKRGAKTSFLTFHSHPYTPMTSITKVAKIANVINSFQGKMPLFACNLAPAQKAIRDNCNPRFRTILYRRMMMRIATILSDWRSEKALVTGEQLGQVASQTLENMSVIDRATEKLILRPLVGMDKQETIKIAEKLGTFELSKIDVPDSCTIFAPDSPATTSKLGIIEAEERKLDIPTLIHECLMKTDYVNLKSQEMHEDRSLKIHVESLNLID